MTRRLLFGEDKARAVRTMFDSIAPRYDLVNRVMTFGMDVGWRRKTAEALLLPAGSLVFDVACGTGDLCRASAGAGYRCVGFDFSHGMLARATTTAPLVQADALRLPVSDGSGDGITCGFALRNVVALEPLFAEFARVLRPGGRVSILEVSRPESALLRTGHHLYFHRVVPLIGGLLSDRDAYRYLPASTAYLPDGRQLVALLRRAGFLDAFRRPMGLGAVQLLVGTRR